MVNILINITNKELFRNWLENNYNKEKECYLFLKRGKPIDENIFYYIDAIEVALCFGWIDSTVCVIDGVKMQRFSPRQNKSNWTELNKERVRRLEKLELMTDAGRKVLPNLNEEFCIDSEIEIELKNAQVWINFKELPLLYQKVRSSNLMFYKQHYPESYKKMLKHTIETLRVKKTFGEWNDYGRLIDY